MSNYYIATRATFSEMESAVGSRVGRLNQSMATTLRQAAMSLDIKQKTKDGGRLEFYSVDQAGYDMLTDTKNKIIAVLKNSPNVRPLAWLNRDELGQTIDSINAKYGRRMDYATHCKYLAELKQATGALLHKLEDDVKAERTKYTNDTGLRVGDMIPGRFTWKDAMASGANTNVYSNSDTGDHSIAVITKITDAGYQYQVYVPRYHHSVYARLAGKNMNSYMGSCEISIQDNPEYFVLSKTKTARWSRHNPKPLAKGDYGYDEYSFDWDYGR